MNNRRAHWWQFGAVLVLAILVIALAFFYAPRTTATVGVEDTPENREIVAAIQRSYDVMDEAYLTQDPSILSKALADDPINEREIGREQAAKLRDYITLVSGHEKAQNLGYLSAIRNKLSHWLHGEQLLAQEMAKATAEGREWTDADTNALAERNFGEPPRLRAVTTSITPYELELDAFRSIQIDGDYARATYERVVLWTVVLKRIDGQWYIVSQHH